LEQFIIRADDLECVAIAGASRTVEGPDLAVAMVPEDVVGRIMVGSKAFYNLETRRARMVDGPPEADEGLWGLLGVVEEWSSDLPPERGFKRVKGFRSFFGCGPVSGFAERGLFDYLTFETRFGAQYEGPKNYGGMSGGGIWQVLVKKLNGAVTVSECLLCGVAYYQSVVEDGIDLACHGRRSVYVHGFNGVPVR